MKTVRKTGRPSHSPESVVCLTDIALGTGLRIGKAYQADLSRLNGSHLRCFAPEIDKLTIWKPEMRGTRGWQKALSKALSDK